MPAPQGDGVLRVALGRLFAIGAIAAAVILAGGSAFADDPRDALRLAVDKTAAAKSAHIAITQTTTGAGRSLASRSDGTLSHGDQDVTTRGDGGDSRRVAVGTAVYERRPNTADAAWLVTSRPAPASDAVFGALTLRDGTSLGDPKLFRSVTDAGTEPLPQGDARKIIAELDMSAVAAAMQVSAADAARMARMSGRVTIWITTADGRIARDVLTLTVPTSSGATTIESTIDLSDLDAQLLITQP